MYWIIPIQPHVNFLEFFLWENCLGAMFLAHRQRSRLIDFVFPVCLLFNNLLQPSIFEPEKEPKKIKKKIFVVRFFSD